MLAYIIITALIFGAIFVFTPSENAFNNAVKFFALVMFFYGLTLFWIQIGGRV